MAIRAEYSVGDHRLTTDEYRHWGTADDAVEALLHHGAEVALLRDLYRARTP